MRHTSFLIKMVFLVNCLALFPHKLSLVYIKYLCMRVVSSAVLIKFKPIHQWKPVSIVDELIRSLQALRIQVTEVCPDFSTLGESLCAMIQLDYLTKGAATALTKS